MIRSKFGSTITRLGFSSKSSVRVQDVHRLTSSRDAWECWNNGKQGLLDQLKSEAGPDKPGHVTHIHWQGPYACKLEFWWS